MGVVLSPGLVVQFTSQRRRISPWILYQNKLTMSNISAEQAQSTHPASNMVNPQTTSFWSGEDDSDQSITVSDLDGMIDAVGIARHNFGTDKVQVSIEGVTAESSPDYVVLSGPTLPGNDDPLLFKLDKDAYSSIRVLLEPTGGVAPRAAVMSVGELLVIPTGISPAYTPIGDSPEIDLSVSQAQRGEYLGSWVLSSGLSGQTSIKDLTDSWFTTYMRPFLDYANRGGTFFWAWAPIVRPLEVTYSGFTRPARSAIQRSKPMWDVDMYMFGVRL